MRAADGQRLGRATGLLRRVAIMVGLWPALAAPVAGAPAAEEAVAGKRS